MSQISQFTKRRMLKRGEGKGRGGVRCKYALMQSTLQLSTSEVQVCRGPMLKRRGGEGCKYAEQRSTCPRPRPRGRRRTVGVFLPKIPLNPTLTEFCFALALVHWNSTELLLIEKFRDFAGVEFKLRRRRRREGGEQRWGPLAELFFFLDLEKGRGKDEGARYYYR